MAKTWGDATLPQGMVTFLVGDDEERVEHVSKCNLCARSVVFRTMFGIGMKERDAAEVTVSHTDLTSFTALVRYLLTDKFDLGEEEGGRAQRALDLRELAQMYQGCVSMDAAPQAHSHTDTRSTRHQRHHDTGYPQPGLKFELAERGRCAPHSLPGVIVCI